MTLSELIKRARERQGLTQEELAERVGVTRSTVSQWENGDTGPKRDRQELVAQVLDIPITALSPLSTSGVSILDVVKREANLPVYYLSGITMTTSGQLTKGVSKHHLVVAKDSAARCLAARIDDPSMAPDFNIGDDVIVDRTLEPRDGDYVIACSPSNTAMLRRYIARGVNARGQRVFDLQPKSPDFDTFTGSAIKGLEILGVVIEHRRKLR